MNINVGIHNNLTNNLFTIHKNDSIVITDSLNIHSTTNSIHPFQLTGKIADTITGYIRLTNEELVEVMKQYCSQNGCNFDYNFDYTF